MYTPMQFAMTDDSEVLRFMRRYSFATIVTVENDLPSATHLPFTIKKRENIIVLISHFAKANLQWQELTGSNVLVSLTNMKIVARLPRIW